MTTASQTPPKQGHGPGQERGSDAGKLHVARWVVVQQFFHSGGLSVLIKVVNGILAYAMLLLIARATTAEQYGIFAVAFSVTVTGSFIATVGQPSAVVRFWPQWIGQNQTAKAQAYLKYSLIITGTGLAVAVALMILGGALAPAFDLPWPFWVAAATALFTFAMGWAEYLSAALRAQGSVLKALAPRDVAWRVLACAVFSGVVLTGLQLNAGIIVVILALLLLLVICPQLIQVVRACQAAPLSHLDQTDRHLVTKTTTIMWATSAFGLLRNYAGIMIVSAFFGVEAAGAYFAAERTANLLSFILLAVNLAAGPLISKYYHSKRYDIVQAVVAVAGLSAGITALIGVVFLVFFGNWVLSLFDPSYASFFRVLMILSIGQLTMAATGPVGLLLILSGHERITLILSLSVGSVGICVQILGGIYYGAIGVALAAAATTIAANLVAAFYAWRRLGIDPTGVSLSPQVLRKLRDLYHDARRRPADS